MAIGKPKGIGIGVSKGQPIPISERRFAFWEKVARPGRAGEDRCWLWSGGIYKKTGYGRFAFNSTETTAHRFAWIDAHGPIPLGLLVCHKCDVRLCCNPAHLFIGTAADNNADMVAKGRERHPGCPNISVEQVRQIRAAHIFGKSGVVGVSKLLGLPYYSVKCALDRKRKWRQVK